MLHFDSHLDSWDPKKLGGGLSKYAEVTHGSLLHLSREEGLLSGNNNMHLGSRSMLFDKDYGLDNDARCGFSYIRARELDVIGLDAVIERIVKTVVDQFVYLRVDIDVLDPGMQPWSPQVCVQVSLIECSLCTSNRYNRTRWLDNS